MRLLQWLREFPQRHPKLSYFLTFFVFVFPLYVLINQAEFKGHVWGHALKTPLDTAIPYWPGFIFVYASLLYLMSVPFLYIRDALPFQKMVLSLSAVSLVSCLLFIFYPTYDVLRPAPDASDLSRFFLAKDDAHDAPYNCFPSLHVGYSLTVGYWIMRLDQTWTGKLIGIWAAFVAVSTLFVKEHYIADVIGGTLIATFFFRHFSRQLPEQLPVRDVLLKSRRWLLLPLSIYGVQIGVVVMQYWKKA